MAQMENQIVIQSAVLRLIYNKRVHNNNIIYNNLII
jgi:hypothetical protein